MSHPQDRGEGVEAAVSGAAGPALTVYYDGGCPLCTAEIDVYRRRPGADAVTWVDASTCDAATLPPDIDRAAALARFHVRDRDGVLISGGQAFAAVWSVLPGLSWIGLLFRRRPLALLIDRAYDAFLVVRPRLQALARRVSRRRAASV